MRDKGILCLPIGELVKLLVMAYLTIAELESQRVFDKAKRVHGRCVRAHVREGN